ncbi:hypothetical protein KCU70_g330, partial [Aureobasidium melanogenum]
MHFPVRYSVVSNPSISSPVLETRSKGPTHVMILPPELVLPLVAHGVDFITPVALEIEPTHRVVLYPSGRARGPTAILSHMVTESDVQYLVSKVVAVEVEPECVDHSVFLGHNDEHCWCRAVSTAFLHGFLDSRSDGSSYEFSGPLVTILIKLIKVVKRPIVLHASDEGVIRIRRNGLLGSFKTTGPESR